MVSVAAMQRHAAELCQQHEIDWHASQPRCERSYALIDCREIHTAPIRGAVSYGTALHEIGHIVGRYTDSRHVMTRETWAWRWARRNALIWTPAMQRSMDMSLAWYRPRAGRIDRRQARWPTVAEEMELPSPLLPPRV